MIEQRIPVILDTDIGTDIDDLWALVMLLGCPELDPWLILTSSGDTRYRTRLTAKILECAGRTDIPIGTGIADPQGEQYELRFQESWLADYSIDEYRGVVHDDGVEAMIDLVRASQQPVTIISIAGTTNLANALKSDPGMARKCRFVGMHGSIHSGYLGKPGAVPETNVRLDITAFRDVLSAPWKEIVITPLDTCGTVVMDGPRYRRLFESRNPLIMLLMENYRIWSQHVTWFDVDFVEKRSTTLFDTVAVYLAYSQDQLTMEHIQVSVDDRGLTYLDPGGTSILAALSWKNQDAYYDHLLDRLIRAYPE